MILSVVYVVLGALGGQVLVSVARRSTDRAVRLFVHALMIASFIYVAFAMASMETTWLAVEILGVGIFATFAIVGLRRSLSWLWLGWALHILWDVGLHLAAGASFVPAWYPMMCVGFDAVVAYHVFRMHRFAEQSTGAPA